MKLKIFPSLSYNFSSPSTNSTGKLNISAQIEQGATLNDLLIKLSKDGDIGWQVVMDALNNQRQMPISLIMNEKRVSRADALQTILTSGDEVKFVFVLPGG